MIEKTIRVGNRISGLVTIVFGGIVSSTGNPFLVAGGSLFVAEGLGDLISGNHHYISSKIVKYFSRGKIDIVYRGDRKK